MALGRKTYFDAVRRLLIKLAKLARFKPAKMPMKYGSWPTWSTFVPMIRWDFKGSNIPCEN